jgi:hypothetical protein
VLGRRGGALGALGQQKAAWAAAKLAINVATAE